MPVEIAALMQAVRLVAVVGAVAAAVDVLRYRGESVAAPFIWTVGCLAAWGCLVMFPDALRESALPGPLGTAVGLGEFAAVGCTVVCWFVYIRRYTGHRQYGTWRRVWVMLAPVVVTVAMHMLLVVPVPIQGVPVSAALAVVISVIYLYLAVLFVVGTYLLVRLAQRYRQVPVTQVVVLGVGIAAPSLTVFLSSLTQPVENGTTVSILPVDISSIGFLVGAFACVYATRRYSLFTTFPDSEYVARDEVLEDLTESMFILDPADRILDMNAAATGICQEPTTDVIGEPINTVFDDLSQPPTDGVQRTTLQTPDGPRQFEISASALQDGEQLGTTLLARDVTAKTTREQQLAVLTRVLRHNLRNDIDTALAYTNEIEDEDVRAAVRSQLDSLAELSANARDIDAVISKAHEPQAEIDVVRVVDAVITELTDDYDCEITVAGPDEVALVSHRWLLSRLLTELIENAITHTEQATPRVEVAITEPDETPGAVRIDILDNGPGIPDHEQAAIRGQTETPLAHSSGVGLWLANWIAASLGGDLTVADRDPTGTRVTVILWA